MPTARYSYTTGRQPLEISALSPAGAYEFFNRIADGTVRSQNRWTNAMLFLTCGVDWPAWQELHERTFAAWKIDASDFYDPWKMTDEFETLCRTQPIQFGTMYQALSVLPSTTAAKYVTVAYHSRQLLERNSLRPDDVLTFEELLALVPCGLVAFANTAPVALLLTKAKSSDLAHCFAQLGLPKAKNSLNP